MPTDLLDLIGDYAGDDQHKLRVTFSKKRGFISDIIVQSLGRFKKTKLRKKHWRTISVGQIFPQQSYLTKTIAILKNAHLYESQLIHRLHAIHELVTEPLDYILVV